MPNFLLSMAVCERHGRIEVYIFYDKWAVSVIVGGKGGRVGRWLERCWV